MAQPSMHTSGQHLLAASWHPPPPLFCSLRAASQCADGWQDVPLVSPGRADHPHALQPQSRTSDCFSGLRGAWARPAPIHPEPADRSSDSKPYSSTPQPCVEGSSGFNAGPSSSSSPDNKADVMPTAAGVQQPTVAVLATADSWVLDGKLYRKLKEVGQGGSAQVFMVSAGACPRLRCLHKGHSCAATRLRSTRSLVRAKVYHCCIHSLHQLPAAHLSSCANATLWLHTSLCSGAGHGP